MPPRNIAPQQHIGQEHQPNRARDAQEVSGHQGQGAQGGGFLQQAGADLFWRSPDTGKDAELVNPGVHGNREGIVYDDNQGEGCHQRNQDEQGKQQPGRGILGIPDQVHRQKLMVVEGFLRRNPRQFGDAGRVFQDISVIVKIEVRNRFFVLAFLFVYYRIFYSGEISDRLQSFVVDFSHQTALPGAVLQCYPLHLIFPHVVE